MAIVTRSGSPFYTGTSISTSVPSLLPAAIDGHAYILELSKYQRRTLPALRPPADNNPEPGEQSLNTEGYWRRTQNDWSLGAGQTFYDNESSLYGAQFRSTSNLPTSRRRFLSSKGVDIWTPSALSLLYDTESKATSASTNLQTVALGADLYWIAGSTIKFTTDPTPASPTFTTVTTTGLSTVTGFTSNGSTVYACDGAKLMSGAVGASSLTNLGALTPTSLFFCSGRLIGMSGAAIYEIAAAGTKTDIKTHDNSSFTWTFAAGAPNGIYLTGNAGDRNEVYYVGVDSSTGGLTKPVFAMNLPFGETLNCMYPYDGIMLLGTSKGFRVAQINETSNGLFHGPLVTIPGGVKAFDFQGQYAWFSYTNYDGTSTGLGRINLAEFTEPLIPAYASDLMATTQGTVTSVATFGSRRYFTVSGVGLYGETANKVASGTLTSSKIRYSTSELKVVSSLDLRHDALAGTVGASVLSDDGTTASTSGSMMDGTLGPTSALSLGTFTAESFQVIITLNYSSADHTTGPTLRRWTARAIATPFRTEEFIVPVILKREVGFNLQDFPYDPYAEFLFLKGLEASRSVVRYQEGSSTYNVYVDGIAIDAPDNWLPNNSFYEGVFLVRLLTVEATT